MKFNNVVICAAGLGSRLGLNMPKCLVKLGNKPLIYHLLKALEDVPNIRIVVGFKEGEVIDYVQQIRKDVVFVRNPDYMTTSNSYSLYLGSRDLKEPFLNIDGDLFITRENLELFNNQIIEGKDLIGITRSYTEDAVYTVLNKQNEIVEFTREKKSDFEWTGLAYFATIKISKEGKYVYQEIEPKLPIKACEVECYEIDTPRDLEIVTNKLWVDE
jgi:choline kinase